MVVVAVRPEEHLFAGLVELVVRGEVREVEVRVAHAGVLPVDDPEALAVVNEVRAQQVVVTGAEPRRRSARLDSVRHLLGIRVLGGHAHAVRLRRRRVRLDDTEGIEAAGERGPVVESAQHRPGAGNVDLPDFPLDVVGGEIPLGFDERHHLGADTELRRDHRRCVLGGTVDPQQLAVLPCDPEDERVASDVDAEVAVRDPARERLDAHVRARPHARRHRLDAQARILSPAGS